MEIVIHISTKKIDTTYKKAIDEYIKRTSPFCRVSIKTYKNINKLSLNKNSEKYIVVPSINTISSTEFATLIQDINLKGISCIEYIITDSTSWVNNSENQLLFSDFCISSFDMNIDLTTVVLTEQIYRAYTILNNITYHK